MVTNKISIMFLMLNKLIIITEMMDVRKQKDMTGFYRHFMRQATGEEEKPNPPPLSKNKLVIFSIKK